MKTALPCLPAQLCSPSHGEQCFPLPFSSPATAWVRRPIPGPSGGLAVQFIVFSFPSQKRESMGWS